MHLARVFRGLALGGTLAILACSGEDTNVDADVDVDDDCELECDDAHTECVAACDDDTCVVDCDTTETDCVEECE